MKNLFSGLVLVMALLLASCQQQPVQYVPVQQQSVAQVPIQGDAYTDPMYANQPPVQYTYNGNQLLIDAALMAYLYDNHIDPGYYYSTHRNYRYFHTYSNGHYAGYSSTPRFVTVNHYHYVAPRPQYIPTKRDGTPDKRYNVNRSTPTATPNRIFNMTKTPTPSASTTPAHRSFNMNKTPQATPQRTFNMSKSSSSSSSSSSSHRSSSRH